MDWKDKLITQELLQKHFTISFDDNNGMSDQNYAQRREASMDNGGNASYYELPEGAAQLQDLLRPMSWNQANIMKATYRWDKKPDLEYNLRKIIFFAQDELDIIHAQMKAEAMKDDSDQC